MPEIQLKKVSAADAFEDVLDLATRARDYVILEVGHAPDTEYIRQFFEETPPGLSRDCLSHFCVMLGEEIAGIICIADGYELPGDWWLGLVLLDPAYRGRGYGKQALDLIKEVAAAEGKTALKLAVLDANIRAKMFWAREGFDLHRLAPATPDSDGHDRLVLRYTLNTRGEQHETDR
ncbi:GNAT family N-acetyltransferase [uncultured Roseobacter sp.]|uniref:GNAT family N-acetyltransferase n=1 Tax=uncultured Roseobacter sp. TaxID=114847 RepID=UPI002628F3AD|nr:GNAT family N-acetyltransferase [uncultured Roseobacter sp.]